mmetsp:Transcript_20520/g.19495  ORF Transcript_20520/g.19495 Transcript_20520/m.19495 type:complete len:127 (+) Transcript_20520:32-412(+)
MQGKLGKYILVRTLGSGAYSKVKLARDDETGQFYAIKIMKGVQEEKNRKLIENVISEVQTMSKFNHQEHPFIVNLIEFNKEGILEKPNGTKKNVFYIALELASGGELFDYVATSGAFNEAIARYYF